MREKQAFARLLPEISLLVEEVKTEQEVVASDINVLGGGNADYPVSRFGLNLNQTLFDWERFEQLGKSKQETALAGIEIVQASKDLMLRKNGCQILV